MFTSIQDIENKITEAIRIKDEKKRKEEIVRIIYMIKDSPLKNATSGQVRTTILNMNVGLSDKLRFFMVAHIVSKDKRIYVFGQRNFFDLCFKACAKHNEERCKETLELIKSNEDFQKDYAMYFKRSDYYSADTVDKMKELFQLPMFKKLVLTDEDFICNVYSKNRNFYLSIPPEYRYLLAYYTSCDGYGPDYLYITFLESRLNSDQIQELIDLHDKIYNIANPFEQSEIERLKKLRFTLKEIFKDINYFDKLSLIRDKASLDLFDTVSLAYKYRETTLMEDILENEGELSLENRKKISYLATSRRKPYIQNLSNVKTLDFEGIEDLEEEIDEASRVHLAMGPTSTENHNFYPDGASKEARRIDKDGRTAIKTRKDTPNTSDDHIDILEVAYGNEVSCDSNIPQDFAESAARQLGSISELTEKASCHIYLPENPSLIQKKICIDWLRTARGEVGLFVIYDKKVGVYSLTDELIDIRSAIKCILKLGDRITEEELDKVKGPKFYEGKADQEWDYR